MSKKQIFLAGGCFWGVEKYLAEIFGVIETNVGYANGQLPNPVYEDVCNGNTGYVEAVKIVYNSAIIDLVLLLQLFFEIIDPTVLNRQGNDIGTQYRTGIYYEDENDLEVISSSLQKLQANFHAPVVVEVEKLKNYYEAEDYHQKYLDKNPSGYCHIPTSMFLKASKANRTNK